MTTSSVSHKPFYRCPPWRTILPGGLCLLLLLVAYVCWQPGRDIRDGRHDRGRNGLWLQHGWLGDDAWFLTNQKTNRLAEFRNAQNIAALARLMRTNHIRDVFPHLCPATFEGQLPDVDAGQTERFLEGMAGLRVIPWIGGVNGVHVIAQRKQWREAFVASVQKLLAEHPRLAGVQVNIEPWPSGDADLLKLLQELKAALPKGKILSVAAYPPPTRWHPYPDLHWDEAYFREVARHCDQLAVMMYDTGLRYDKLYQRLMADWTQEVLVWAGETEVLLGLPAYEDADVGYHRPEVENQENGLQGIHRGLEDLAEVPDHYQGTAVYCEWEMTEAKWQVYEGHFLR